MNASDIKVGSVYLVRFRSRLVKMLMLWHDPARLDSWQCCHLDTSRKVWMPAACFDRFLWVGS
jgi:hypothetical protein